MAYESGETNACLCGNLIPKRPVYRKPADHCSYWCFLVGKGVFSLEQVAHMIPKQPNRR